MKKIISLCNFSNFESGNCGNGGKYGFKTIFKALSSRNYEVCYKTTSHLDYCDKCGEWHDTRTCSQEKEVISEDEVIKRVREFNKNFVTPNSKCFIEAQ